MTTLQVLCPNGRRQNVRINPNTKLLQVLEDVCQKQKFLPAEDFKLVHGRTTLDLTLSVRFSNLANNAKLELVKCEKSREESEVLIALQLESGERLQHSFSPGTSVWDLLLHWENLPDSSHRGKLVAIDESQKPPLHPVCIYMREEVIGEQAMKETKLRMLGLTGGKAVLRLTHRPIDETTLSEVAEKIEKQKLRKARLEQSTPKMKINPAQSMSDVCIQTPQVKDGNVSSSNSASIQTDSATISLNINVNIQNPSENKSLETGSVDQTADKKEPSPKIGILEGSQDGAEPMEVEASDSNEMDTEPTEEKIKSVANLSSDTNQGVTTSRSGNQREAAEQLRQLNIPGVQVFTPDDFSDLSPEEQQIARRLAEAFLPRMGIQPSRDNSQDVSSQGAVSKKKKPNTQPAFSDFKFPEATKGQNLYNNDMSEVNKEDFKPCDRQTTVYNLEETILTPESSNTSEIPDDFFEITENDMKKLLVAQKKKMDEMMNQPLMTSSMRKARLEEEYGQYERVVIRIQFQDKLVLQGTFRPRETVFAIQKFVKDHLEDKSIPFYLYTAPPKYVIKDVSQTLIEARLVPATVVYFGCDQHKDHYLSTAVMAEQSPRLKAEQIVAECLNSASSEDKCSSLQPSSNSKGKQPVSHKSQSSSTAKSSSSSSSTKEQDKSVPKWFKIGKK